MIFDDFFHKLLFFLKMSSCLLILITIFYLILFVYFLQNNLARKREQMKHMKMPELTELAENPSESSETSKSTSVVNSSGATFTQPPPPTDNMVLPSIPDSFLMELGLFVDQYANFW